MAREQRTELRAAPGFFGRCTACRVAAASYIPLIQYKCEHDLITQLDMQIKFLGFWVSGINGVLNCFPLHSPSLMLSYLMWKQAIFSRDLTTFIDKILVYLYIRAWQQSRMTSLPTPSRDHKYPTGSVFGVPYCLPCLFSMTSFRCSGSQSICNNR